MNRPNILFLMSDEHRADVAGFTGNDIIRTPNLDWMAKDGVVFDNAYCPSPICVPGRQATMAGQYCHTCGCLTWRDLPPGYMTIARQFTRYAYKTVAAGKLHHEGLDPYMGFVKQIGMEGLTRTQWIPDKVEEEYRKYEVELKQVKWTDAKEIKRAAAGNSRHDFEDEYALQGAIQYVDNHFVDPYYDRQNPMQPLLLYYGTIQPHYPYLAKDDKFRFYLPRVKPYLNQQIFPHDFLSTRKVEAGIDVNEREVRRATAAYYAMVETVDDRIGRLMDSIRFAGQDLDDWIIIYTTDHGEMLGEHGVWEKQKFFEGSSRVPLVIRYPRKFHPGRVKQNVNLIDLFATLCDLCGLPAPAGLDSRSLVNLACGNLSGWENETSSQFMGKNLMIKRDNLKYHFYKDNNSELLFDLEADSKELRDYSHDTQYTAQMEYFRTARKKYGF